MTIRNPFKWNYERLKDGTHWYTIGGENTSWNLGDKLKCALENPATFRSIDLIADKVSQVKFLINGEENENHPLIKAINNPNPFQSKQDFIKEYVFFKYAYGWVYQYPVIPTGFDLGSLKHLYNLNPSKVEYNRDFPTRLIFEADSKKLKKEQFKYSEAEQDKMFDIGDIIPFFDIANGLSEDFLLIAPSRLDSIQRQIKNMAVAAEAKQRAIQKAGRFIVTGENQGSLVNSGLGVDEKKDIEQRLSNYGLANKKNDVIASTAKDIKTHSLHISLKDLGLDESTLNDSMIITNAFGIPRESYPVDKSGSTYENQKQSDIKFVQGVIQTEGDDLANTYKSYFGIEEEVTASFEHLPEMQHVENLKADKMVKISASIRNIANTGVSEDELFEMAGINREKS